MNWVRTVYDGGSNDCPIEDGARFGMVERELKFGCSLYIRQAFISAGLRGK